MKNLTITASHCSQLFTSNTSLFTHSQLVHHHGWLLWFSNGLLPTFAKYKNQSKNILLINHYLPFLRICFLSETKITVWEFGNRPLMAETCQKQMEDSKPCYHIQQKQNVMKQAQLQILLTLTPANTMFLAAKQTTSAKIFFFYQTFYCQQKTISCNFVTGHSADKYVLKPKSLTCLKSVLYKLRNLPKCLFMHPRWELLICVQYTAKQFVYLKVIPAGK